MLSKPRALIPLPPGRFWGVMNPWHTSRRLETTIRFVSGAARMAKVVEVIIMIVCDGLWLVWMIWFRNENYGMSASSTSKVVLWEMTERILAIIYVSWFGIANLVFKNLACSSFLAFSWPPRIFFCVSKRTKRSSSSPDSHQKQYILLLSVARWG